VASFTGSFGTFSSITAVGHGESALTPPDLLLANTIDTATSSGGTLTIWITDQGLTSPSGLLPFESSFTANLVPKGWTVDEETFVSATNALFSGTPLDATTFNAISTNVQFANAATGTTYSVSEEFVIHANSAGDANNTIDLSAQAPEPSVLFLLGGGLLFIARFGALQKKRHDDDGDENDKS
jgi:hypothetical protein